MFSGLALGCAVPVANDLDEPTANRVVAALGRHGVAAEKQRDPEHEGRFSVDVGRGDASFALAVMTQHELPPQSSSSVSSDVGPSSLIPSRAEERARLLASTAAELQRSLLSIDGIIAARVHLALARDKGLGEAGPEPPPSASVLLKHAGLTSPLSAPEVSRLIAGAVPGLDPSQVVVVMKAVEGPADRTGTELVRLGPLTTTRSSLPYLRWMMACVATLNVCMVALLFALWLRGKRTQASPEGGRAES